MNIIKPPQIFINDYGHVVATQRCRFLRLYFLLRRDALFEALHLDFCMSDWSKAYSNLSAIAMMKRPQ